MSSIRLFCSALIQHPAVNHDVVTRMPPARAFLIHGGNQLTDVTNTNDRQIPLGLDDREATNQRVSVGPLHRRRHRPNFG